MSGDRRERPGERFAWAVVCWLLVALPLAVVTIPPITDLPQQLAQIPLLGETLSGGAPEYRVQWLAPNKLSYPLLALCWLLFEPFLAGRVAMFLVAGVWIFAIHRLAAARGRPVSAAILASVFTFSHAFYMGYANFLIGLAAFVFWFLNVGPRPPGKADARSPRRIALVTVAGGLLLFYSHALWLVFGVLWLLVIWRIEREPQRVMIPKLAAIGGVGLLSVVWYLGFLRLGWRSTGLYGLLPWERLVPGALVDRALGGVTGWLEPATLLLLVALAGIALWQHRRDAGAVDRRLLITGLFFLALALLLADKQNKAIHFASRWAPCAATFLVLALPLVRPRLPAKLAALAWLALFSVVTARTWGEFERRDLAGLETALHQLPSAPALLGLDFRRESPLLKFPPFLQQHAWGQLLHGGRLGFSFVDHASSLVIRRDIAAPRPWTKDLEWHPEDLKARDLDHFGFVLINAESRSDWSEVAGADRLKPLGEVAPWRLFRISPDGEVPARGAP